MRSTLVGAICLFIATVASARADTLKSLEDAVRVSDDVMQQVEVMDMERFFEILAPYFVIPKKELEAFALQYQNQMRQVGDRYGKTIDVKLAKEERIEDFLYQRIYLQRLERHFLLWEITFYKPNGGWVVNNINFHDSRAKVFETFR